MENELKQLYEVESLRQVRMVLNVETNSIRFLQVRYNLHAVCVHEGSATVGHFWTYVYHDDRQKWFRYNDNEGSKLFFLKIFLKFVFSNFQSVKVNGATFLKLESAANQHFRVLIFWFT